MSSPAFELTGTVSSVGVAEQLTMHVWKRDLILDVTGKQEAGQGPIRIDFLQQAMDLLDGVQLDDRLRVWFTVQGIAHNRGGQAGHLVALQGQRLQVVARVAPVKSPKPAPDEPEWEAGRWPSSTPSLAEKKAQRQPLKNEDPPF